MSDILNEHWKVVSSGGRNIATTPEELWGQAIEYFKWNDTHKMTAKKTIQSGKNTGDKVEIEYRRPYSVKAMCLHCNISERYIQDIKNSQDQNSEWYMVIEKILYIIYTQNLEGAMVDIYNPIIVSKVLNMDQDKSNDQEKPTKVEIVDSISNELSKSENDILKNLDYGKVEILKEKVENIKKENL